MNAIILLTALCSEQQKLHLWCVMYEQVFFVCLLTPEQTVFYNHFHNAIIRKQNHIQVSSC